MGKARSCRRTADENVTHGRAVKLRKMTDEQLVEHLLEIDRQAYNYGYKEGFEAGKKEVPDVNYEIGAYIEAVAACKGIGKTTVMKMKDIARMRGVYVD